MEFVDVTYLYISSLVNHHHSSSRQKVKEEKVSVVCFVFDVLTACAKPGVRGIQLATKATIALQFVPRRL